MRADKIKNLAKKGEPISARAFNTLVDYVISLRPRPSDTINVSHGIHGVTFDVKKKVGKRGKSGTSFLARVKYENQNQYEWCEQFINNSYVIVDNHDGKSSVNHTTGTKTETPAIHVEGMGKIEDDTLVIMHSIQSETNELNWVFELPTSPDSFPVQITGKIGVALYNCNMYQAGRSQPATGQAIVEVNNISYDETIPNGTFLTVCKSNVISTGGE